MITRIMTTFSPHTNPLREKIESGEPAFGVFVSELYTPWLGAMLDAARYDFCILDMEHGAFSLPQISAMVAGFQGGLCTPIVRIPAVRREIILPIMDLGTGGIMVPGVETAEEVRQCVDFMKYPPLGSRGLSLSRPHAGFASPDRDGFLAEANARSLLVVQVESPKGVENLDEILKVPGVDVAFVGCADLSLSMGVSNDPKFGPLRETLEKVLKSASNIGVAGGANLTQKDLIATLVPMGLRLITCSTDTKGFIDGLSRTLQNILSSSQ